MSHNSLIQTGLQSIYYGPTHEVNNLDKLYGINIDPKLFNPNTYVSHIKTHHLGVIALPLNIAPSHNNITRSIHTYRRRHPNQHEACLDYLSSSPFNLTYDNTTESVDSFYTTVKSIFYKFYPLKQITIKSSDPPFINPFVKSILRQKDCLMRKGKIHQTTSITNQIRNISITSNKISLAHSKRGSKAMWSIVNKLRGKIPDVLPNRFLKFISLAICEPLSTIYNNCIKQAFFPAQWKISISHPIEKINNPTQPNQHRPISITPIFSRILEKYIVKDHIYPCLTNKSRFDDQFAFRPTGSHTSAIIYLTSVITFLLTSKKFIRLIALDFSKAFNALNNYTLITNMASLQLDDSIHNSLISFFLNRTHSTKFLNKTSSALSINSSVVQGSVLGPSSFIINPSSLKPVHLLNKMIKFADDNYLVIPSSNSNSLQLELDSLTEWAKLSNLSQPQKIL